MSKHTPGPWSLPHFAQPDVNCSCEYVLTDGMMGAVCSVHCTGEGDDWLKGGDNPKFAEAVANAHLIAAAPEMYAALREVVGALRVDKSIVRNPAFESDDVAWLLERIDAALAKADPTQ